MRILACGLGLLFIGAMTQAEAAPIVLTPTTPGVIAANLGPANCEPGCVEDAFGLPPGSLTGDLLYKANQDGTPDEGSFAGSYDTEFDNTPADPEDATISWINGQPSIVCPDCYLAIKDGNQNPSYYFYNLGIAQGANGIWDGVSDIIMTGFWPDQGAISHVSIWGTPGDNDVPEPALLLLFAGGLGATAFTARRRLARARG